jgi:hypothetical protein
MKLRIDLFIDNLSDHELAFVFEYVSKSIGLGNCMPILIQNEAGDTIGECEIVE